MHVRKVVLLAGMLCSLSVVGAEWPEGFALRGARLAFSADRSELICSCTVRAGGKTTTHLEAGSITIDRESGIVHLGGAVRIRFDDGSELRGNSVAVQTDAEGVQEFSGDNLRIAMRASDRQ